MSGDTMKALDEIEAALADAILNCDYSSPVSCRQTTIVRTALTLLPTLRAALTPPVDADTEELRRLMGEAELRLPLRYDEATRNVYTAEEEYDGEQYHSWLAECGSPSFGRLSVAAVNALPGLLAVKAEKDGLRIVVQRAGVQFRYYEEQHRLKGPEGEVKARVNAEMAEMCESALEARAALGKETK